MAKKKSDIIQRVGPAEAMRLGSAVAQRKRRMSEKDWKKLVADAHQRGRTVRSQLFEGNMPDALRERTKSSLKAEAEKNVADAYKPATDELDSAAARAKALSAKRAGDNIAFRSWMDQQAAAAKVQSAGAQARYDQFLAGQQAAAAQDIQGQAQAAAQGTPGTVSDMKDSKAIQSLSADEKRNEANVAAARAQSAAMIPGIQAQQNNLDLAARGAFEAAEARRRGDENKDLTDVFTAREKLATSRASDIIKEYSGLLDKETSKAQGNRDYAAAAEKLGLDSFKAEQDARQFDATLKVKTDAQKLAEKRAKQDKDIADAKIKVDYDKIAAANGKAAADRALKRELDAKKAARGGKDGTGKDKPTDGALTASRTADQRVSTVRDQLIKLHERFPTGKSEGGKTLRDILMERGYDSLTIDVAEDLRKHKGKLSARGRLKARRLGIRNPEQLYGSAK